jgi:hypothetical protein
MIHRQDKAVMGPPNHRDPSLRSFCGFYPGCQYPIECPPHVISVDEGKDRVAREIWNGLPEWGGRFHKPACK